MGALNLVSERLGHATVSITLDTYSHAIPAMQEEAALDLGGGRQSGQAPRRCGHGTAHPSAGARLP